MREITGTIPHIERRFSAVRHGADRLPSETPPRSRRPWPEMQLSFLSLLSMPSSGDLSFRGQRLDMRCWPDIPSLSRSVAA